MKNEPQLSAEMERKAEEVFEHYNGDGYANPCPRIPCDCQVKEYKHFLATALEEQRMQTEVKTGLNAFGVTMEEIAKARAEGAAEERTMIIEEIKQVCKVHRYLDDKTRDKVIRFIENLGKPQPEMALTTKEHHAS